MASMPPSSASASDTFTLPLVREELDVSTRDIDTGRGVRLRTTVTERIEELDQLLHHQEVHVERVPVDRIVALDAAPITRQEGDTLIVPIVEEVLVVEKRLRIKEEVRITRLARVERHVEQVPLREEQLVVERFDEGASEGAREGASEGSPAQPQQSMPPDWQQQARPQQDQQQHDQERKRALDLAHGHDSSARHDGLPDI